MCQKFNHSYKHNKIYIYKKKNSVFRENAVCCEEYFCGRNFVVVNRISLDSRGIIISCTRWALTIYLSGRKSSSSFSLEPSDARRWEVPLVQVCVHVCSASSFAGTPREEKQSGVKNVDSRYVRWRLSGTSPLWPSLYPVWMSLSPRHHLYARRPCLAIARAH